MFPIEHAGIVLFGDEKHDDGIIVTKPQTAELEQLCSQTDLLRELGKKRAIQRIDQEPACAAHCKLPVFLVPLTTAEGLAGVMLIGIRSNKLYSQDIELLTTYAAQAAITVVQARLIHRIKTSQAQLIQAERQAAIGKLAANVAHEFNNVLMIICNSAEVAMRQSHCGAHQTALGVINATAKRGGSISRGLLTFARQYDPRREHIFIQDAIEPVLAMLANRFRAHRITVECELAPRLGTIGDLGLMSQAVLNLVNNAMDAMPDGGTLTIKTWQIDQTIRLSVQDTGGGIPAHILARLFDAFTTSKHPSDRTTGGNGLGLAITHAIVTSHGGTIAVQSTGDDGTTITITLPAVEAPTAPKVPPPIKPLDSPQRIMVVDDEPLIALNLSQMLEMEGHHVVWFNQPQVALAEIDREPPDVLIADIHMPGIDGIKLLRYARERDRTMRQLLVTGQVHVDQQDEVLELGVQVMYKPFSATDICAILGHVVSKGNGAAATAATTTRSTSIKSSPQQPAIHDELRHQLLNHVSALEGMFRIWQRSRGSEATGSDRIFTYLAQSICELSIFVRSQRLLGLLDHKSAEIGLISSQFPLKKLLDEAQSWAASAMGSDEPLTIQVECPDTLEITADSKSLLTALLAALQNATEALRGEPGEHAITISAAQHGDQVALTIEDTGAGFTPEAEAYIANHLNDGQGEQFIGVLLPRTGVGLGIALMVRVARLHGGNVTFRNRQDRRGAQAQFVLPLWTHALTKGAGDIGLPTALA
jgi:signal transduction histidine kinase/ActR/RegA family two-component response regulator